MARWRAEALSRLPDLRRVITSADNIMALWIDLESSFEKAYKAEPRDESSISRIYAFADWCLQARPVPDAAHDPCSAVVVGFYEHIPTFRPARDDMPRWFTYDEVAQNKHVFSYHIGDEAYQELVDYMRKNQRRHLPRARLDREA